MPSGLSRRAAAAVGAAASLAVYAIPLVGPHAIQLGGPVPVRALGRGDRTPGWVATDRPRFARSGVAFLGSALFAYTEVEAGQSRLVVLRVPG
jgi:hypothetical protein